MNKSISINRARFWKITWFFATVFIHAIWWDLWLRKIPFISQHAETTSMDRWRKIARRFRDLSLEMGGVLIKLGQFLSIRVDILPIEVIQELMDLQDEVPPENIDDIIALIEADFGRPLDQIFAEFDRDHLAAASLAQTHRAVLMDGQAVVVKVQRPGIDVLVHTDLASIALALRWLKLYPRVARRVNLDWLATEFTEVTTNELDFQLEGKNAERFMADFADDPDVYFPKVYWDYSADRVITLENVAYIRMADLDGMDEAGIDRVDLARKLYKIFLHQVFVTHFVHADPHPGNLFVKPLPRPADLADDQPTPYQVVFIDFGMVAAIPERLFSALRNYAIGLGTRDAHKVVQSYIEANTLLPGADIKRLEEAHQEVFDRYWGIDMSQMKDIAMNDADYFLEEYRDLVYEAPFQVQVDMLFALRGMGLLSGIATNLDPNFDPWGELFPFARSLATDQLQRSLPEIGQKLIEVAQRIATTPEKVDNILTQLQRGSLTIENSLSPDARRSVRQVEQAVTRLTWAVMGTAGLLSGVLLRINEGGSWLSNGLIFVALYLFIFRVLRGR
ncbi:MAG: AarF/UbiB family protein [Chloroflexota bacterium]